MRTLARRAALVRNHDDGWRDLQRVPSPTGCGTRCAALVGDGGPGTRFHCTIYEDRPAACSELEVGSEACVFARERLATLGLKAPP